MKLTKRFLFAVLLLPAVAAAQMAPPAPAQTPQGPPAQPGQFGPAPAPPADLGKWWKNSEIVRELQLTDAQVNQIEQAFFDHRLKLIYLRAELERQETRLQPLIEADQPDEAKVSAQIDQVLAARGRLEKANAMMMLAIRRVLTVEQWKKLQTIQQERERMFRAPMPPAQQQPSQHPRPPRPPDEP